MKEKEEIEISHDVGMVNPFALYDVIRETRTSWETLLESKEGQIGLRKMFESTFNFEYRKLWDPKNHSPLYTWTQRVIRQTQKKRE